MSQIKERPILFSAPMVRAILDGRKTVTRRAFKGHQIPQWSPEDPEMGMGDDWHAVGQHHRCYGFIVSGATEADCAKELAKVGACPYGRPGDRLWVREAWQTDAQLNSVTPRDLSHGEPIQYPADWDFRQTGCAMIKPGKIRPSIHMPRWGCRILLEITDVRVERLQDISEDQAKAEGVRLYTDHAELGEWWHVDGIDTYSADPRKSFELLWSSVGGDWVANPWVWVVEFKRVTP
ncbi:hypothetical protein PflCFBP13510_12230 [Pseudomonas fluorescens]|nr:hypothetical protein PflCFBP13510_12230 [Pseudomonas fluorescens]